MAIKSLRLIWIGAAVVLVATLLGIDVSAGQAGGAAQGSGDRAKFVGTYEAHHDRAQGRSDREVGPRRTSTLTGTSSTPRNGAHGRAHNAEGARAVCGQSADRRRGPRGASRIFSVLRLFSVDDRERDKTVVHRRFGQIRIPAATWRSAVYNFITMPNGNQRLVLTPPPAGGGGKEKAARRVVWQRMPEAPLSAEEKKFVGYYRLQVTDSYRTKDGKRGVPRDEERDPRGHVLHHLHIVGPHDGAPHGPGRADQVRGAQPTPDEALKAYRRHSGYFGRFRTYETHTPRFVYHSQPGWPHNPGSYSEQQRFYELAGNVLRARRATEPQRRRRARGWATSYWERQGALK